MIGFTSYFQGTPVRVTIRVTQNGNDKVRMQYRKHSETCITQPSDFAAQHDMADKLLGRALGPTQSQIAAYNERMWLCSTTASRYETGPRRGQQIAQHSPRIHR